VGRIRDARARFAAAAAIGACLLAFAGCGGDGDDGSSPTQAGVQLQTPTAPTAPDSQGNRSPPDADTDRGSTATTPFQGQPGNANPPGVERIRRALGPFRSCVSGHGVDLEGLQPGSQDQPPDPAARQKRIQAMIACIPELPPRLRERAEVLKERYQQRQGGSG
jgi:hypothetical protein